MKLALIYPPACDPTAPYLSVPMLAGFLRPAGVDVLPIDANIEGFDRLLSPASLSRIRDRIEDRIAELDARPELSHVDAVAYGALWRARGDGRMVPGRIEQAKSILRDPVRFYEPDSYASAVAVIEASLRAVSAAYHPTFVDFMTYRTPFGLTTREELESSAAPEANPFDDYLSQVLIPRLRDERPDVLGLSVCFPGQVHPAYLFALRIKRALPEVHLTVGGAGITQILSRLSGPRLDDALAPFDSAVLFEGEHALLDLLRALEAGNPAWSVPSVIARDGAGAIVRAPRRPVEELAELPSPDFDGMPLGLYLAPVPVLPYDPTRGCYWGKCAFCHYGLTEKGTARYRERPVPTVVQHLQSLAERHGARHFYLSHDSIAPKTIVAIAGALGEQGTSLRWATDLKPERYIDGERARVLRGGGAVACALGVESASNRVLRLIDKGQPIEVVAGVIENLAAAGIAVEAMCFTGFPTESYDEALRTLRFVRAHHAHIAGFIVGEFGLTHGSVVASEPGRFGIRELWELEGDRLGLGLMFAPERPWKTDEQLARLDEEVGALSSRWALRPYPWAGAVSTSHTILYYDRFGPGVFRELARKGHDVGGGAVGRSYDAPARFNLEQAGEAQDQDQELWATLVFRQRRVSRAAYESLASKLGALKPSPAVYAFRAGAEPREHVKRTNRRSKPRSRR